MELNNIIYKILPDSEIEKYVIKVCEQEWDPEDFQIYGDDLYKSAWSLEEVDVNQITINKDMFDSDTFQADVRPRVENQKCLSEKNTPIPPLILRGRDFLIFDGYARYTFFKSIGIKKCLAYIGRR